VSTIAVNRRAVVLRVAYDYFRYRVGFKRPQPPAVAEREQQLLLLQNALSRGSTETPVPSTVVSPDKGHATGRIGLSYGFSNRSHFEEISLRPAIRRWDTSRTANCKCFL